MCFELVAPTCDLEGLALFPLDRRFLEFRDVEVDVEAGIAHARYGARCAFVWESGIKICAFATPEG